MRFISTENKKTLSGENALLITEQPALFASLFGDSEFQKLLETIKANVLKQFIWHQLSESKFPTEALKDAIEYGNALGKYMDLVAPEKFAVEKMKQFLEESGPIPSVLPLNPKSIINVLGRQEAQTKETLELLKILLNSRKAKSFRRYNALVNAQKKTILLLPILGFPETLSRSFLLRRVTSPTQTPVRTLSSV